MPKEKRRKTIVKAKAADDADSPKGHSPRGGEDLPLFPPIVCAPLGDGRWLATEVQERTAAVGDTKERAEDAVRTKLRRRSVGAEFFNNVSASELARTQGVKPVQRIGQIRTFSVPDPAEADWFARMVRRWRRGQFHERR